MILTRWVSRADVLLLNFAYEEDPPMGLELEASDERDRGCIQLYHATVSQVDLTGNKVLEVGCGHGGGASYIKALPGSGVLDRTGPEPVGLAFCKKRHTLPGLDFVQGDAQDLPFPDQSFDAVVTVESANYYPDQAAFFSEVARVLRPGGHFLYTDCQPAAGVEVWEATLVDAPLRKHSQRDINAKTMRGMEMHSQHWWTPSSGARRPSCGTLFATAPRWPAGSTTRA
jgi:fatty-acid O-methyltransferase